MKKNVRKIWQKLKKKWQYLPSSNIVSTPTNTYRQVGVGTILNIFTIILAELFMEITFFLFIEKQYF